MSLVVHTMLNLFHTDPVNDQTMLSCNLCGSSRVHPLFSESREERVYTSYHCQDCGLHQTLGDIDPISPDYIDLEEVDFNLMHRFLQTEHKLPAFRQWQALVEPRLGKPLAHSAILDIGCGIGGFLDFVRPLKLTTYGFDASKAHAVEAQNRHDSVRHAKSVHSYFEQLSTSPRIDLVTLWDVFEHVRQPTQMLAEIREVLKPSNGLLFISVPSGAINPIKVRIASALNRPIGLIPWEHVFYYTPKSLKRAIEGAGFEVLLLSGVQTYVRNPLTVHEIIRRMAHHLLRKTPYAMQLYVLARPVKDVIKSAKNETSRCLLGY